jgi:hypothetical protein
MKIRPMEAELFYAGGRTDGRVEKDTDTAKLIVTFHSFSNPPNNNEQNQRDYKIQIDDGIIVTTIKSV